MCELFPELHRDIVGRILRNGVRIEEEDSASRGVLECLHELGIVAAHRHTYVRCAHPGDYDYLDRQDLACDGRIEVDGLEDCCPLCGQPIGDVERKAQFAEYEVELRPGGIESYLPNAIGRLDSTESLERIGYAAFRVELQAGAPLKIVVPEYAELRHQSAGLFFAEPTLYITASTINEPVKTILEERQYMQLADILCESAAALDDRVRLAAVPIQGRRDLSDLEARFDVMLDRHGDRRWQFFEQELVPAFILHMTENPELSEQYLWTLKRLKKTVFGMYYVPIGGSGVTDLRGIDKYELMAELIRGGFIGDAKCYPDSALGYQDLVSVVAHLETDPTRPQRAIVFVAGDNVTSTAWNLAMQLRDRWGHWRLAIIPRYLLIELISELDATRLLET